jgi:DHA1 family tetracycline resistance protein-like MFS transporter
MQKSNSAIIPLFIIALLNEISYQMVIPVMNHVVNLTSPHAGKALTDTLYGAGIAAFTAAIMLGSPLLGFLSDRWGRKPVLTACLALTLLSSLLCIFSLYFQSIAYFLTARVLSGFAGAGTAIVQAAVADRSARRVRGVHFSIVGLALTIGLIAGPLLGGYFVKGDTATMQMLSIPFVITALLSLMNIIFFLQCYQETKHETSDYDTLVLHAVKGKTIRLLTVFFLLEFSWSLYFLVLPSFLSRSFYYDSRHISVFMSATGIAMCLGLLAYRFISHYLNNIQITIISFGMFILSLSFIIVIRNLIVNWCIIMPVTWSVAVSYVALMGLLSESVRKEHQGTMMGTSLTTMAMAWTMTGFGVKFLFEISSALPFIISIAGLAVGIILVYRFKNPLPGSLFES